jgi:cutinase
MNMTTSSSTGVDDTISRLNKQSKTCPQQKFALVGYSQGAGVMHGVFGPGGPDPRPKLDPDVIPKIVAVVMFGDPGFRVTTGAMSRFMPQFPPPLQSKLKENCAAGDPVSDYKVLKSIMQN